MVFTKIYIIYPKLVNFEPQCYSKISKTNLVYYNEFEQLSTLSSRPVFSFEKKNTSATVTLFRHFQNL